MNYPKYRVISSDNPLTYEFYSEGPRGKIRKAVFFTPIGNNLFNLGFGDWNEDSQDVDDSLQGNKCVNLFCMSTAAVHKKVKASISVNPDMPDYNSTPFAKKKAARTRALISKYGIPNKPKKGK